MNQFLAQVSDVVLLGFAGAIRCDQIEDFVPVQNKLAMWRQICESLLHDFARVLAADTALAVEIADVEVAMLLDDEIETVHSADIPGGPKFKVSIHGCHANTRRRK